MRKPVIAITPQYDIANKRVKIEDCYLKAIKASGGVGILLPLYQDAKDLKEIVEFADGFLYTGGPDMNPFYFHEEALPECGTIVKDRDQLEYDLLPYIIETRKPVLGICRGIQVLNITLGGDIFQDIPSQYENELRIAHYQKASGVTKTHYVHITEDSLLSKIIGKESIAVNSYHHQAVRRIGTDLTIAAIANDGIVEAVSMENHRFFLGLQWHPEELYDEDEDSRKIFDAFVAACQANVQGEK